MMSGVRGVYIKRLFISPQDVAHHRRLLNYMLRYSKRYSCLHNFSKETVLILNSVSSLSFVPCFYLAYTCCRINELNQVNVEIIKSRSPIIIKSSKSRTERSIDPIGPYKLAQLASVDNHTPICVLSYDSLNLAISKARDIHKIKLPDGCFDATHIFRHLEATHLFNQGVDVTAIAKKLGHKNEKTSLQYIHKSFNFLAG